MADARAENCKTSPIPATVHSNYANKFKISPEKLQLLVSGTMLYLPQLIAFYMTGISIFNAKNISVRINCKYWRNCISSLRETSW